MNAQDMRDQLDRMAAHADKNAANAPEHDGTKRRWEIFAKKIRQLNDLSVLDNLITGGPDGTIHSR